jgi:hypothetical protein
MCLLRHHPIWHIMVVSTMAASMGHLSTDRLSYSGHHRHLYLLILRCMLLRTGRHHHHHLPDLLHHRCFSRLLHSSILPTSLHLVQGTGSSSSSSPAAVDTIKTTGGTMAQRIAEGVISEEEVEAGDFSLHLVNCLERAGNASANE